MTDKTPDKTGKTIRSPRSGAVVMTGAHPKNTGGKKGRSGRKPDEFKAYMQTLVGNDKIRKALERVLKDSNHKDFLKAFKMAAEFAYGKAKQQVELTGDDGAPLYFEGAPLDLDELTQEQLVALAAKLGKVKLG